MLIVYIGLAIEKKLIFSYSPFNFNYADIVRNTINALKVDEEYRSSMHYKENSMIYYIHSNYITYICIEGIQGGNSNTFNFLLDTKKEFESLFPNFDISNYNSSSITEIFKSKIEMKVDSYNNRESESNNDRDKQTLLLEIQKEQSGYKEKNIIKGGNPNPFFVHFI